MLQAEMLYHYKAVVRSVYDGDTVRLDIDLGCGVWLRNESCRLAGIDTPELRGSERDEGLRVRDIVRGWLPEGRAVTIQTHKDRRGKYGRYLVTIWACFTSPDGSSIQNVNQRLLDEGLAKIYGEE